ncbi:hypothetical protein RHGRI_015032 [Rhododendron griersonianum]|uniref:Uncharacterized protein n=1 Tax=Rhododendron griersonianum TaxID=479676 RepID=A0AAV6KBQ2_9ERIC|nr:hypothetical protein RHGRI_015032 [Rhododendron griersonianum]
MVQISELDHTFEGMSVQEILIAPTLEQGSTNHIAGRIVREHSYSSSSSSSSSSSPRFLIGVVEDNAATVTTLTRPLRS